MKKLIFLSLMSILIFSLLLGGFVLAKKESDVLTNKEINTLINSVGITVEEISDFPVEVLRELIEQDAKKLAAPGKKGYNLVSETVNETSDVTINALTPSDIYLNGAAFTVTSDRTGYKKIYLYGSFDWNINPVWKLIDMMSIGYPSSSMFILPMNGGQVQQFYSVTYNEIVGYPLLIDSTSIPAEWDFTGVASKHDLYASATDHFGYIRQYVYVEDSISGTCNIKIRYGHRLWSGTPSVSIYPFGLSVTPELFTETLDYGLELVW